MAKRYEMLPVDFPLHRQIEKLVRLKGRVEKVPTPWTQLSREILKEGVAAKIKELEAQEV